MSKEGRVVKLKLQEHLMMMMIMKILSETIHTI